MRKAVPVMTEEAVPRKPRVQQAHDGRQKPRLQMLSRLASGQAQTRQAVAQLLGVQRQTIGHWLALDDAGGLEALLALDVPAGTPLSLPPDVRVALEQALRHPAGFASYAALRQWGQQTSQRAIHSHTLYRIVRTKFQTQLQVARPRHTQNP